MSGSSDAASFASDGAGAHGARVRTRPGLVFIRPPKTASSSVEDVVMEALGLSLEDIVPVGKVYRGATGAITPRHRFVRGHVTWDDAAWLLADPAAWQPFMTFRDPIDRTVSHYRYLRRLLPQHQPGDEHRRMCSEALARPLRELVYDDTSGFYNCTMPLQTLYLGSPLRGRIPACPLPDEIRPVEYQLAALHSALGRLEGLAWIGIVESLARDVQVFAFSQGWPPVDAPHVNRTKPVRNESADSSELDPATRRVLADRLAADYVLLESAREIAVERYREMVERIPGVRGRR